MAEDKKIIDYLIENEIFFINVLDKFNRNFLNIPKSVGYYPFYDNNSLDSLIAFLDNGYFYAFIKDRNLDESAEYLINNFHKIFSLYGYKDTTSKLVKLINKPSRYSNDYLFMKLEKKDFNASEYAI